ncbi:MAG: hypothetical protein ACK4NN_10555 [Rheinheimera sp.]
MKLFNAQSKKQVKAAANLNGKILDTKFLNSVAGGILIISPPVKPKSF